jgi:cytochrome P450
LFFGAEVKSLENFLTEDKRDLEKFTEFSNSFNQTTVLVQKRIQNPFVELFKNSEIMKNFELHVKVVHNFIKDIVEKRLKENIDDKNDLLSRHIKKLREENKEINEKDLLFTSVNFLLAGIYLVFNFIIIF